MTKELKPFESTITKLLLRLISVIKIEDQDLLHAVLSFYINPKVLIRSLEKIGEIGGASKLSKANLELTLNRISIFIVDDMEAQKIYESAAFMSFVDSLINLPPKNYSFLIKQLYVRLKGQQRIEPALLKWFDQIIEKTAHLTLVNSNRHFVFQRLYLQGYKVPLKLQPEPDEEVYFANQFKLAAGHYFPNSYDDGWEDYFN